MTDTKLEAARQIAVVLYDHVGGRSSEDGSQALDNLLWNRIYQLSLELVEKIEAAVPKEKP